MENPSRKIPIKNLYIVIGVLLLFVILMKYVMNKWSVHHRYIFIIVGLGAAALDSKWQGWRYYTKIKLETPERTFSISGTDDIYKVGKWLIFHVGGIKSGEWNHSGGEGIVVIPQSQVDKRGNVYRTNIEDLEETPIEELPPIIRQKVENKGFEEPYRWGVFPPVEEKEEYSIECPECDNVFKSENKWIKWKYRDGKKEKEKLVRIDLALQRAVNDIKSTMRDIDRQNKKRENAIRGDLDLVDEIKDVSEKGWKDKAVDTLSGGNEED